MALRDTLAKAGDLSRLMDDFAVLYLQDPDNFAITDEGSGQGPPTKINDIVEIDPNQASYGEPNSANGWRYAGDTVNGLALNIGRETRFLETDQHARAIEKHQQWNIAITGGLAQYEVEPGTLDNLLAVLGGGTMSDIAGATPTQKRVKIPLGSEVVYQRAALIYPHEYNGTERTLCVVLRKCAVKATGEITFQGRNQASIPVSLEALPDDRDTVPEDEMLAYILWAPGS